MMKIISFLTIVVLAMGLLSACATSAAGQVGSPTPVSHDGNRGAHRPGDGWGADCDSG